MFRTVGKRLGRVEGPATSRAHRSLYQGEISPAGGTEKRDAGITNRIIAEGTGGRKDKIQNTSEEAHSTSKFQITTFKRQIIFKSQIPDCLAVEIGLLERVCHLALGY
jgi:hypothetical protein